ncbi:MAG: SHOCT domain-containing protein [Actinomycetota bacterium]
MHYGNWNDGMGGGYGWWIFMTIMMVVFWGGLIWFAATVIRRPNSTSHDVGSGHLAPPATNTFTPETAQEILDKRLARGEIELDDYRLRSETLRRPKD